MSSYIPHNPAEPADRHAAPAVTGGRRVTLKAVHQWSADTTGNALGRFDHTDRRSWSSAPRLRSRPPRASVLVARVALRLSGSCGTAAAVRSAQQAPPRRSGGTELRSTTGSPSIVGVSHPSSCSSRRAPRLWGRVVCGTVAAPL